MVWHVYGDRFCREPWNHERIYGIHAKPFAFLEESWETCNDLFWVLSFCSCGIFAIIFDPLFVWHLAHLVCSGVISLCFSGPKSSGAASDHKVGVSPPPPMKVGDPSPIISHFGLKAFGKSAFRRPESSALWLLWTNNVNREVFSRFR